MPNMDSYIGVIGTIAAVLGGIWLVFLRGRRSGAEKLELKKEKVRHDIKKAEIQNAYRRGDTDKLGNALLRRGKGRK
jgi:hypothetical protein